jgi:hypothetical protein
MYDGRPAGRREKGRLEVRRTPRFSPCEVYDRSRPEPWICRCHGRNTDETRIFESIVRVPSVFHPWLDIPPNASNEDRRRLESMDWNGHWKGLVGLNPTEGPQGFPGAASDSQIGRPRNRSSPHPRLTRWRNPLRSTRSDGRVAQATSAVYSADAPGLPRGSTHVDFTGCEWNIDELASTMLHSAQESLCDPSAMFHRPQFG